MPFESWRAPAVVSLTVGGCGRQCECDVFTRRLRASRRAALGRARTNAHGDKLASVHLVDGRNTVNRTDDFLLPQNLARVLIVGPQSPIGCADEDETARRDYHAGARRLAAGVSHTAGGQLCIVTVWHLPEN